MDRDASGDRSLPAAAGTGRRPRRVRAAKKRHIQPSRLISISFLPSIFTLLNLFLGFQALLNIIRGNFQAAITLTSLCVVLDGFDGTIARLTKTESSFGVQLDSLVDAVSFGLAPAALIFFWAFKERYSDVGAIVAFIFLAAGVIRLARFNVFKEAHLYPANVFIGLPIPLGALSICAWVLLFRATPPVRGHMLVAFGCFAIAISLLMVSKIRYRTVKNLSVRDNLPLLLILAVAVGLVFIYPFYTLPLLTGLYILLPLLLLPLKRRGRAEASAPLHASAPAREGGPSAAPAKPGPGPER